MHRSPAAMFISPLRRYSMMFVLGMLVILIAGVWYLTNPKRISRLAQILLSNVLGGKVEVRSGRMSLAGTLELSGVTMRAGTDEESVVGSGDSAATQIGTKSDNPILFSADQVKVRFDWLSLLLGDLRATQITATRPTLTLVEDIGNKTWNYQNFQTPKNAEHPRKETVIQSLPVILLREARVQWGESEGGKYKVTGAATIDGQLSPTSNSSRLYQYSIDQRQSTAFTTDSGKELELGHIQGTWDLQDNKFSAITSPLTLGPNLLQAMPRQAREWCVEHKLTGALQRLQVNYDPENGLNVNMAMAAVGVTQNLQEFMPELNRPVNVDLEQVSGEISFLGRERQMEVRKLKGRILGREFLIDGKMGSGSKQALVINIALPKAVFTKDYPDLFEVLPATRDLIYRLRPRGTFDISVKIFRAAGEDDLHVNGMVLCKNVDARFIHFPYPMHNVNGPISFDDTFVYFTNVTAMAEENPVLLNGKVALGSSDKTIDMTVSSEGVYVDERLALSLPARYLPIWQQFNPEGYAAFTCQVTHGNKKTDEQHVTVHVLPKDVQAMYRSFPVPMKHLRGDFTIRDEKTTIKELVAQVGRDNSGKLTISGEVLYPAGDLDAVNPKLNISAQQVPLEPELLLALPEEHRMWTEEVQLAGKMNFDGRVERPHEETLVYGTVVLNESTLSAAPKGMGKDVPWQFSRVNARGQIDPMKIKLEECEGRTGPDGQCIVHLEGELDRSQSSKLGYQLKGDWRELHLNPQVSSMLPEQLALLWKDYHPTGALDGTFHVAGNIPLADKTAPSSVGDYSVELRPHGLSINHESWPDKLTEVQGYLKLTPTEIKMENIRAQSGPAKLEASGVYYRLEPKLELSGKLQSDQLPVKWVHLLPKDFATFVLDMKPEGNVRVDLKHLSWVGVSDKGSEAATKPGTVKVVPGWEFGGDVVVAKLATQGPMLSEIKNLEVNGEGAWHEPVIDTIETNDGESRTVEGGLKFKGKMRADTFTVASKPITNFQAIIEAPEGSGHLQMSNIGGKVAGGTIQGELDIQTDNPMGYQATFVLNDAELASLLLSAEASAEERKKIGTGRVTANLAVQEKFGGQGTRTGRGDLVVRDGTIYDVPLSMGLMQVATLRLPVARAFNSAQMSYYIRDNKVTFEKILLESDGFNLAGMGTLSLKDQKLDMRLVTDSASDIRLPVIDPLRGQLLQLQVGGTIQNPQITPIPLDAVYSTLQSLLPKRKAEVEAPKEQRKNWLGF